MDTMGIIWLLCCTLQVDAINYQQPLAKCPLWLMTMLSWLLLAYCRYPWSPHSLTFYPNNKLHIEQEHRRVLSWPSSSAFVPSYPHHSAHCAVACLCDSCVCTHMMLYTHTQHVCVSLPPCWQTLFCISSRVLCHGPFTVA